VVEPESKDLADFQKSYPQRLKAAFIMASSELAALEWYERILTYVPSLQKISDSVVRPAGVHTISLPMKPLLILAALVTTILPTTAAPALTPNDPIELTGTTGKFDFIKVDAANRRLLACHTGNGTLDIIDVDSSKLIKSVPTGNAQGVAIDEKGGRYFVSCSKPPQLTIVDSKKLEVIAQVPLPGPADLCAYSSKFNRVFVDNDTKPEMWVVNPDTKKITESYTLAGSGMEDLAFSADGGFFIQNIKDTSKVMVLDCAKDSGFAQDGVIDNSNSMQPVSTLPAEKPHGLAMLKYQTGKILASCDIAPKVDEIAYDPALARAYCASGTGQISVVFVAQDKLTPLGNVPSAPGAHSIAVDPKTHQVWIVFAKDNKPYVQSFNEQ